MDQQAHSLCKNTGGAMGDACCPGADHEQFVCHSDQKRRRCLGFIQGYWTQLRVPAMEVTLLAGSFATCEAMMESVLRLQCWSRNRDYSRAKKAWLSKDFPSRRQFSLRRPGAKPFFSILLGMSWRCLWHWLFSKPGSRPYLWAVWVATQIQRMRMWRLFWLLLLSCKVALEGARPGCTAIAWSVARSWAMGHVFISPCELRLKTACLGVPKKFACCAAVLGGTGAHAAFVFAVASKSSFWVLFGRILAMKHFTKMEQRLQSQRC